MATIKSYTDISQSKKLAEILPLESADMEYMFFKRDSNKVSNVPFVKNDDEPEWPDDSSYDFITCWGLAALLDIIPTMIGSVFEKDALRLRIDKSETDFNIWYENLDTGIVKEGFDIVETNPIDACYEMIIMLSKNGLI